MFEHFYINKSFNCECMYIKKLKWFALACFCNVIFASQNFCYNGFYAGLALGYGLSSSDYKLQSIDAISSDSQIKSQTGLKGFVSAAYGGYNCVINSYNLLGIEISADRRLLNVKGNFNVYVPNANIYTNLRYKIKIKSSLAISLRGGLIFQKENLAYMKLGIASTQWHATLDGFPIGNSDAASKTKNKVGVIFGLGLEIPINSNILIGPEWCCTYYNKVAIKTQGKSPYGASTMYTSFSFKPIVNILTLKLSYKF